MILDIGCGFPNPSEPYLKRGDIGVDTKRGYADIIADAHSLPFRDGAFTRINVYSTLDHLAEPYKALTEAYRVTTDELILEVGNCEFWAYSFNQASPLHLYQWSRWTLRQLLEKIGFTDISVTPLTLNTYQGSKWEQVYHVACSLYPADRCVWFNAEILHVEAKKC